MSDALKEELKQLRQEVLASKASSQAKLTLTLEVEDDDEFPDEGPIITVGGITTTHLEGIYVTAAEYPLVFETAQQDPAALRRFMEEVDE